MLRDAMVLLARLRTYNDTFLRIAQPLRTDGPGVMKWCESHGIDFVFGIPMNKVIRAIVEEVADCVRTTRAIENAECVRDYAEIRYGAKSWGCERRVIARIEATRQGLDIRAIVMPVETNTSEYLYADHYCARGTGENMIKLHKTQLKSDRMF